MSVPNEVMQQQLDIGQQPELGTASVFEPAPAGPISVFDPVQPPATSSNAAANRALQEQYLNSSANDFEERFTFYQENGIVMDAVTKRIMELDAESHISDIVQNPDIPLESKLDAIRFEMNRLPYKQLSPYDDLLFQQMRVDGGGMVAMDNFNKTYQEAPMADIQALGEITRTRQLHRSNRIVQEVAAAHGWSNFGDMLGEVTIQDFLPIWNVASRLGLANFLADNADIPIPTSDRLLPGSVRARMREHLVSLEPAEFEITIGALGQALTAAQADPVLGPLITDYNAMEFWTAVFNDEVLRQGDPQDNIDKWLGNAELGFEALFGTMVLAKVGGKTAVRAAFSVADKVKARQVAVTTRNSEAVQSLTEMLQTDGLAAKFQVEDGGAALLPKPSVLDDSIEYLPDGERVAVVQARQETLRTAGQNRAGAFLSPDEKFNVIKEELREIDEFDGPATMTRMSTIEVLDNDEGFRIKAIFGETPNKGYSSFEDAAIEALELDPELRKLEIVRVGDSGTLEVVEFTPKQLEEFVLGEAGVPATRTGEIIGDEYFLRYTQERAYHPFDKEFFGKGTLSQSAFRWAFTPNAKFKSDFYNQFASATFDEERTVSLLNRVAAPYRNLAPSDKRAVDHLFEWAEGFGKTNRRVPTFAEIRSNFPETSAKQLEGYEALSITYDTMYEMLNRRQYNEWMGVGFKTAKPRIGSLPTYHGKPLKVENVPTGSALDPVTGKEVRLNRKAIAELYLDGGTVLELDVPVRLANARTKTTRVILDSETYKVGDLSHNPLKYHPGYHFRFYDDPYYVIKREKITVDGKTKIQETAVRTAGSNGEAQKWSARANRALKHRYGEANAPTFDVVRANDIDQVESTILQKEVFQREGRLFYDDRNFDVLPSVNGNRAPLEDQATALERGIRAVSREVTGKDPLRTAKNAWNEQYARQLGITGIQKGKPLNQLEADLTTLRRNAAGTGQKKLIDDALQYIRYFRLMEGTSNSFTPMVREGLINFAQHAEDWFGNGALRNRVWRGTQKWAQKADPLKTMRSTAFTLFMRMRPIRQYIMQSAQPMFLAGIDPTYIGTGRWALDSQLIRAGVLDLRSAGTLPVSVKARAKAMGLSQAQYRKLVKEFDRAGLMDTIDAHDFTGGTISFEGGQAVPTPGANSPGASALYYGRQGKNKVMDFLGAGFNKGEGNNIAASYMVGLRKYMKENNVDDLLKLNNEDWRKIQVSSSNLALAMVKPNSMRYQSGMFSLATQFLSFQHKSALAVMGLNPAIKPAQAARLWASGALLYGADFVGYGMLASTVLRESGLEWAENEVIPGTDRTFRDVIAEGLVENVFNELGEHGFDTWQDLDLKFLSPGPDVKSFYENTLLGAIQAPGEAFFGPFSSIYGDVTQSMSFAQSLNVGLSDRPTLEKYTLMTKAVLDGTVPQLQDLQKAQLMKKFNLMFNEMGEPLDLEPTQNAVYARLLAGVSTNQQAALSAAEGLEWGNESHFRELTKTTAGHLRKMLVLYHNNEIDAEFMDIQMRLATAMWDDMPEGRRVEFMEAVFLDEGDDGSSLMDRMVERMKKGSYDPQIETALEEMQNLRFAKPGDAEMMVEMYRDVHNRRVRQEQEVKERIQ